MPKAGEAYTFRIILFDSDGAIVANPTLAAGDVTVVDADGDSANVGTLPGTTSGDNRVLEGALTAGEMAGDAGDVVTVVFEDQSGDEWEPAVLVLPLTARDIDDASTLQQSDILDDATPFSGADIAAILGDTGTDIPALIAALNDLSASDVWSHISRTLTQAAAQVQSAVEGSTLNITAFATFEATLTGLNIPAAWDKIFFTVKRNKAAADDAALIQIAVTRDGDEEDGLIVLNGSNEGLTASDAELTVDEGDDSIDIFIKDEATAQFPKIDGYTYDIKVKLDDGSTQILTEGTADVDFANTRAT